MQFHEKYLDVLQNIEFGIVQVYQEDPDLLDYDVMHSLEALIDYYKAQKLGREPRNFSLSERSVLVFDSVKVFCDFRLGRRPLQMEDPENDDIKLEPKTIDEIINCLKKILNSVKMWNKRGGRQGYLDFVSNFVK